MTTARDLMTEGAECARTDETVSQAAQKMRDLGVGALPICGEDDRLKGMLTDRDIVVRCVADGRQPSDTSVREAMSDRILYCMETDAVEKVADLMAREQVRRMPVISSEKRLVGIVSLGDIALTHVPEVAGTGLAGVSEPGGQHTQTG